MKILYLSGALLPSTISHSLSIMRMCQAFTDRGHEVVLTGLASEKKGGDVIGCYGLPGGFRVVGNSVGRLWDNRLARALLIPGLVLAFKTRGLVKAFAPDIVYSRLTLTELAFVPKRLPIIYEMHSLGFLKGSRWEQCLFRWLVRRKEVRRIIVTTEILASMLRLELPGVDIVVSRLSAEHPVSVPDDVQQSFRSSNLKGGHFRSHIGYTGYLDTTGLRGTEIVCQAAARMPEAAFHVVGGESAVVEHWRRYADEHNPHGNLFFYGHWNPSHMPLFLGCFDVVVAPLQNRTSSQAPSGMGMSPLKLPQYMSYGKAIVASDLPAHQEILKDGETALLVPPCDVDAWVSAIRSLLQDEKLRGILGENARKVYWEEFAPEVRVQKILDGVCLTAA